MNMEYVEHSGKMQTFKRLVHFSSTVDLSMSLSVLSEIDQSGCRNNHKHLFGVPRRGKTCKKKIIKYADFL